MNIGLFGGTFDPIHAGHLAIIEAAIKYRKLDRVYIAPCVVPPWKHEVSEFYHRYAMVTLTCRSNAKLVPINLAHYSNFAVDEVRRLQDLNKDATIHYIIGADAFLDLPKWERPYELADRVSSFLVFQRPSFEFTKEWFEKASFFAAFYDKINWLTQVYMPLASTDIRIAVAHNEPISRFLLPSRVYAYIEKTGLYELADSEVEVL